MKLIISVFILCIAISSCTQSGQREVPKNQTSIIEQEKATEPTLDTIKSELFQIARFDETNGELDRIFVVVQKDNIYNTEFVADVVCLLSESYPLEKSSRISFFTKIEYANYKDELFFNEGQLINEEEYDKWMNEYYLAEFNFSDFSYIVYPGTRVANKQKEYKINECN